MIYVFLAVVGAVYAAVLALVLAAVRLGALADRAMAAVDVPSDDVVAEIGAMFALSEASAIVEAEARRISAERHPSNGGPT